MSTLQITKLQIDYDVVKLQISITKLQITTSLKFLNFEIFCQLQQNQNDITVASTKLNDHILAISFLQMSLFALEPRFVELFQIGALLLHRGLN